MSAANIEGLKTMENCKTVTPKSGRGCLRGFPTVVRDLTGKILAFWIGGRMGGRRILAHYQLSLYLLNPSFFVHFEGNYYIPSFSLVTVLITEV